MSLHAPFLVKQYLSNDVESGSYSRVFWYFPLDREKTEKGGIGLFFEVISGDVGDEIYEQITKRFWESFSDNFYVEGFEASLKKSIKMFIRLLQNFNVQEGLDVNIVLFNVGEVAKGYTLKLIAFGDSDIFVVRDGKFADMAKMVPENSSLYDLKFLEVELDRGDVLLLGNKTLLRNAFETDMLAMANLDTLLRSLEEFKDNLFGSKKLFLLAATENEHEVGKKKFEAKDVAQKVTTQAKKLFSLAGEKFKQLTEKIKKKEVTSLPVSAIPVESVLSASEEELLENDVAAMNEQPPEVTDISEDVSNLEEEEWAVSKKTEGGYIAPPPLDSTEEEGILMESNEQDEVSPSETEENIIDPVEPLPGKAVSVDDFVVTSEVTPSMVVEKSEYSDILSEASQSEPEIVEQEPELKRSFVAAPTLPAKGKDYVNELRARHSPVGKVLRHPIFRSIKGLLSTFGLFLLNKIRHLFGKDAYSPKEQKIFLSRPASIEKKGIQPGVVIILLVVLLSLFFWVRARIAQSKLEKELLTSYQQQVATFSNFFEKNIQVIDAEDTERQLELCAPEAEKVYAKESSLLPKIKTEKMVAEVKSLTSQVQAKVVECQTKYDKIYGIVRVKEIELVTDFRVSLGTDSDISSITFRGTSIVVADKGRKAVYQINVETKGVIKLEDPLGLVVDPITVGTGEGTLFVCDKTNGVLYYSKNASGNQEGFNRIVGAEPSSIGECIYVDGYAKNAYVVPSTANVVYKISAKSSGGFEQPFRYMKDLLGVKSITIDNFIYVISSVDGNGDVKRYLGGKEDNFAIPQSANLGDISASYTNPSGERNLYVYDKTKHAVLSIEKPNSKHPGRGIVEKTYQFDAKDDRFKEVKSIAVDLNVRNQEVYMYVLAGTTIWRFKL